MRWFATVPVILVLGCIFDALSPKPTMADAKSLNCPESPRVLPTGFRHKRSMLLARLGSPRHRGIDLIAAEGDENQTVSGKLAYTKTDKDLEDEDVVVFACIAGRWRGVGASRTDNDGRFSIELTGNERLPVGMHDLWLGVRGDGSGVRFLGFVAAKHESVVVTDIDGTITSSENAVYNALFLGEDIAHQPGAPETLAASGKTVIYVSARGDQLTNVTREWLAKHNFPRGPIRLAKSMITLPGKRTVAHKTSALDGLGIQIAAGIGNRASDIAAYRNAGLAPDRIFINLPEFTKELRSRLSANEATAFDDYSELRTALTR